MAVPHLRAAWTLAFVLTLSSLLGAQTGPDDGWRWSRFTTHAGLPSNRIDEIVEDGNGTLWAGTPFGIAWFDGHRWQPADERLPPSQPTSMAVQEDGRVVTVVDERLFVGDRDGFVELPVRLDGLPLAPRHALPVTGGRYLVRESREYLLLLQGPGETSELIQPPIPLTRLPARQMWPSADGGVFQSSSKGLYRWIAGTWTKWIETSLPEPEFVVSESSGGHGVAAITSPRIGFHVWTWDVTSAPRRLSGPAELGIRDIAVDRWGEVALAGLAGRLLLHDGLQWTTLDTPSDLHAIRCVSFRSNGDLCVGTSTGLFVYRRSSELWSTVVGHPTGAVHELLVAQDGSLWTAGLAGVHRSVGGQLQESFTIGSNVSLERTTALAEDERGRIWVGSGGTFSGCERYENGTWTHIGPEQGLAIDRVHKIRKDRSGRLWFLGMHLRTSGGPGAFVREEEGRFVRWGVDKGLPSGRVYDFEEAPDGAYWFATFGGLSRYHEGEWTHFDRRNGLQTDRVFALAIESTGRVWFGHQGWDGLGWVDGEHVEYDRGRLPDEEVWELTTDLQDRLWIGTASGACVQAHGARVHLANQTGLERAHVWPILPTPEGIYFGTLNRGLVVLDLDEVDASPARVVVNAPQDMGRQAIVTWDVASPEGWVPPASIQTRFRLGDAPWSPWGFQREAALPPRDTTLTVQALGFLGQIGEGTTHEIVRPKPFFRQPLFIGPIVALSASVLVLILVMALRKRDHNRALRLSERRYRDLFENANDMIFTSDLSGRLLTANRKTREVLGLASAEVAGIALETITQPEHQGRLRAALARALSEGGSGIYELDLSTPSGREVSIELDTIVTGELTSPTGFQSVARDVTGRREVEVERRHAHKMEALGVLAGGVAHDFNNVLSVILGYSDMLLERAERHDASWHDLNEIRKAGERAASLTTQLLAFSRKQMQRVEVFELGELVVEMEPMLRPLLGEDVQLSIERRSEDAWLELDPGQVQQIVLNLAANARDVMPQGGRLTVAVGTTELSEDEAERADLKAGPFSELTVSDTGPGMDAETQRRVFDPFFTTKSPGKGTGLGLSSVYGMVQQSGGFIEVRSAVGAGATFRVLLPRTKRTNPMRRTQRPSTETLAEAASGTVLIVEDEDSVRSIMVSSLREQGYTVYEAPNAHEAQRIALDLGGAVDLLVTDVVMPGMSGSELAERLTHIYPDLRVLLVSGYTGDALDRRGARVVHDVLQKPFGVGAFARKVDEVFGNRAPDPVAGR